MSDKSFGDPFARGVVRNPLLSSAVTGLCIEDLTHKAVLLPAESPQQVVTSSDQIGAETNTLGYPQHNYPVFPSGDTNTNNTATFPNTNLKTIDLDNKNVQNYDAPPSLPVSKASQKSEDDFDVNVYFARLQGTRYVSAPLNIGLKLEDGNANLPAEENLEEINLNEPEKPQDVQQSLTADIAQNFSQLPTVLPDVASAVFSSFTNMLNWKSREQTPDEIKKPVHDNVTQKAEVMTVPLMGVQEGPPKSTAPPLKEPPIGGIGNYRITSKKKYAQIPGLSTDKTQIYNPNMPPHHVPTALTQGSNVVGTGDAVYNPYGAATDAKTTHTENIQYFNPADVTNQNFNINVQANENTSSGPQFYNPLGILDRNVNENMKKSNLEDNKIEENVKYDIGGGASQLHSVNLDSEAIVNVANNMGHLDQMTCESATHSFGAPPQVSTPVIPPPPMFSNVRRDSQSSVGKSVLPPSVARRISANHPIVKPQVVTPATITNIFIPTPQDSIPAFDPTQTLAPIDLPPGPTVGYPPSTFESSVPATWETTNSSSLFPSAPSIPDTVPSVGQSIVISETDLSKEVPVSMEAQKNNFGLSNIQTPVSTIFTPDNKSEFVNTMGITPAYPANADTSVFNAGPAPPTFMPTQCQIPSTSTANVFSSEPAQIAPPMFFNPSQMQHTNPTALISDSSTQNIPPITTSLQEPPKATGNISYRLNKKRPQYYSGPIEGLGAISNNVKPVLPPVVTDSFKGSLFVPEQSNDLVTPSVEETIHPIETQPLLGYNYPMPSNEPQDLAIPHNDNTTFDLSRQTVDNEPTQDTKGFGILGSLKSKLSSIDINKIQDSVTTFFDPSYHEDKNTQMNSTIPNPEQYATKIAEFIVASVENAQQNYNSQQYPFYNYNPYQNQHSSSQIQGQNYYQHQSRSSYSYSSNYFSDPTANQQEATDITNSSTGVLDGIKCSKEYIQDASNKLFPEIDDIHIIEADTSEEIEPPIHSNIGSLDKDVTKSTSQILDGAENKDGPKSTGNNTSSDLFKNISHISAENFFDNPQCILTNTFEIGALNVSSNQIVTSESNIMSLDEDNNNILNQPTDIELVQKLETEYEASFDNDPFVPTNPTLRTVGDGEDSIPESKSYDFNNKPPPKSDPCPVTSYDCKEPKIPILGVSTAPLFGLSAIIDNKPKGATELEDSMRNISMVERPIGEPFDISARFNFFELTRQEIKFAEKNDLDMCETCREVNKPEDTENDDVTAQLIDNITAPIQLLNPVEVPLTEGNTIDNREGFENAQCSEITQIAQETMDTIQMQSINEQLDNVDDVKQDNVNYGWCVGQNPAYPAKPSTDHDYSFHVDPNAIGLFGNNSLFFDNVPNNASDEIKAEYKNSHEDVTPKMIESQNIPSQENDDKSDETGALDVHSIEQDANEDFPLYDEFVIEPSETDDDKIEFKERGKSEDPIIGIESYGNRLEIFKKMEESAEHTNIFDSSLFPLPPITTAPVTIASYFDTGNYAAETHYKNSLTSSGNILYLNSSNIPMRIPPGFEDEYRRRFSGLSLTDASETDKINIIPQIPDTTTQTPTTTTISYESNFDNSEIGFIIESNIAEIVEDSPTPPPIVTSPDTASIITSPETATIIGNDRIETDVKVDEAATSSVAVTTPETNVPLTFNQLADPVNFFSSNDTPQTETTESFNRLASYFASPPKPDHGKSFFELSQSQNHYRHETKEDVTKPFFELSQGQNHYIDKNVTDERYLANLDLIKDLTSTNNINFDKKDQIVRTVNYFTLEYDNDNIANGKIENIKTIQTDLDNDPQFDIRHCKYCCDLNNAYVLDVKKETNYKLKKSTNGSEDNIKDCDKKMEEKNDGNKSVTINLETSNKEDASDNVAVVVENRSTSEYNPVKYHWFYRLDVDDKSVWRGFSVADSRALEEAFHSPNLDENTLVPTDGGRYDVNVVGRIRFAVYWSDKPTNVRRCSWFYKGTTDARYVPYSETIAEKLEIEYRHAVTTGEWHRKLLLPNNEMVVMHGPAVMVHFLHSGASDGFSGPPSASIPRVVRRGCDDSEVEETEPPHVDHLLLLCHGVGSACDMRFRAIEDVVDDFRRTSLQLVQSHYKNSYDEGSVSRIEVLPISWHSDLHSGETGVDKKLAQITLDSIPRLRSFTNETVLDVLFYTSPVYCQTIINTVCREMNRVYDLFRSRNPQFKGGVSVGGHSLGSVILYDLLSHQTAQADGQMSPKKEKVNGAAGTGQKFVSYPTLEFEPVSLYALGSPIAIFECIRGVDSLGMDFALPTCKKFFNIFHPFDPIAYRIEPMINPRLKNAKPQLIPHHKGRKRMHLELKDTMARVGADLKQKLIDSLKITWNKWKPQPTEGQLEKVVEESMEKEQLCGSKEDTFNETATPEMLGMLNGGRRVDYVLQEAPLEVINEYLFAMRSHVGYWESEDTMLLILREIYDALGISPDCTVPQSSLSVQRTRPHAQDGTSASDNPSTSRQQDANHD